MKRENKNKKVTLKTKTYSTKTKALAKEAVEYMMKTLFEYDGKT